VRSQDETGLDGVSTDGRHKPISEIPTNVRYPGARAALDPRRACPLEKQLVEPIAAKAKGRIGKCVRCFGAAGGCQTRPVDGFCPGGVHVTKHVEASKRGLRFRRQKLPTQLLARVGGLLGQEYIVALAGKLECSAAP
jgi:hypothetical protein